MTNPNPYNPPAPQVDSALRADAVVQCPKCGGASATKVNYNWWGGALGPRLFNVVKCGACRTQYNGRTGRKLTGVIIAYQAVLILVILAVWLLLNR